MIKKEKFEFVVIFTIAFQQQLTSILSHFKCRWGLLFSKDESELALITKLMSFFSGCSVLRSSKRDRGFSWIRIRLIGIAILGDTVCRGKELRLSKISKDYPSFVDHNFLLNDNRWLHRQCNILDVNHSLPVTDDGWHRRSAKFHCACDAEGLFFSYLLIISSFSSTEMILRFFLLLSLLESHELHCQQEKVIKSLGCMQKPHFSSSCSKDKAKMQLKWKWKKSVVMQSFVF